MRRIAVLFLGFFLMGIQSGFCQTQIAIPDTISGSSITLTMHSDSVQFLPGRKTKTLGFNQYSYLGPTVVLRKGAAVSLMVNNQIGDTTNVHWHGLHVAAENDGGPHTMVMNGMNWNPQFIVMDKASTYWYHPHFHGKTAEQAIKGAVGFLIVRDGVEEALPIPKRYGVDDFPLMLQCAQLDSVNQFMPEGMEDSLLFVNGTKTNNGTNAFLNIPAQVVRLRLLNGSGERTFNMGLSGNRPFQIIASDGGFLSAPVTTTRVRISPGERYQILVDASTLQGQQIQLMSYASELPIGVQGGPTMPMPAGSPPMDSPLNGIDFDILQLRVVTQTANPVLSIPSALSIVNRIDEVTANTTRIIRFTADNDSVMDGPFYFNDSLFNMERVDYRIPLNSVEIWEIRNQTMVAHPFHIHLVQFNILDRDGNLPLPYERGWKDVVMIESQETVRLIARYETYADSMMPYMFHCHILMHEDDGMMGQFVVMHESTTSIKHDVRNQAEIEVFPNPVGENLQLNLPANFQENIPEYKIINSMGQEVEHRILNQSHIISTTYLPSGIYQIRINSGAKMYSTKFIRN